MIPLITAVIPHYYEARRPNLPAIVHALRTGSVPVEEILIWNNDALPLRIAGARIVHSPTNEGPRARFITALMAKSHYVFFQDNDLMVEHDTIRGLIQQSERHSLDVVSLDGRVLGPGGSYHHSVLLGSRETEPRKVDITLGHAEMILTRNLPLALSYFPFHEAPEMDDIFFNWSCQQVGLHRWVVPTGSSGAFRNLSEFEVGACKEKAHYKTRDELCRKLFGLGKPQPPLLRDLKDGEA